LKSSAPIPFDFAEEIPKRRRSNALVIEGTLLQLDSNQQVREFISVFWRSQAMRDKNSQS
jgi:hypothetical protein